MLQGHFIIRIEEQDIPFIDMGFQGKASVGTEGSWQLAAVYAWDPNQNINIFMNVHICFLVDSFQIYFNTRSITGNVYKCSL
jgi:hypothetical protein